MLVSAFVEFLHSMLLAPVRMVFHTQFVLAALTGWKLDWKSPPRDNASTGWREACRRHGLHTLFAVIWVAAIVYTSDSFAWWLTPILAGLLTAIPMSVWGSRVAAGRALRRHGLLLTPEEVRVPAILANADRETRAVAARLASFRSTIVDAGMHARVVGALPSQAAPGGRKGAAEAALVEHALRDGPAALTPKQMLWLVSSRAALGHLRDAVLAHRAHPGWWMAPDAATHGDGVASPDPVARPVHGDALTAGS